MVQKTYSGTLDPVDEDDQVEFGFAVTPSDQRHAPVLTFGPTPPTSVSDLYLYTMKVSTRHGLQWSGWWITFLPQKLPFFRHSTTNRTLTPCPHSQNQFPRPTSSLFPSKNLTLYISSLMIMRQPSLPLYKMVPKHQILPSNSGALPRSDIYPTPPPKKKKKSPDGSSSPLRKLTLRKPRLESQWSRSQYPSSSYQGQE